MNYYIEHNDKYYTADGKIDKPTYSNTDISEAELAWWATKPTKHFVYIDEQNKTATTWMGDILGNVRFGRPYRDNFGGTRVPVWVAGNNGQTYYGTYYQSSGDYARIYAHKKGERS